MAQEMAWRSDPNQHRGRCWWGYSDGYEEEEGGRMRYVVVLEPGSAEPEGFVYDDEESTEHMHSDVLVTDQHMIDWLNLQAVKARIRAAS